MASWKARARRCAPWGLSAAIHGLAALLLLRQLPASAPRTGEAIAVEYRVVEASPPASAAAANGTATSASTPTSTASSTATTTRSATAAEAPGGGAAAAPLPGSAEWLKAEGLEPGEGVPVPGLLAPPPLPTGEGQGNPGAPPVAEARAAAAARQAKSTIDRWIRDDMAVDRARHRPDAYWSGVKDALARDFDPGWEILAGSKQELGLLSPRQLREALAAYTGQAARYGARGNPHPDGPDVPGARRSLQDDLRESAHGLSPDARALLDAARPESRIFHRELMAVIRLEQEPSGRVARVELIQPSGNRSYDLLCLSRGEALREVAEERLGPTPTQGRETLWAFATSFDMTPPLPVVGCGFDATFQLTGCTYPLRKTSRSQVELRAVY